MAEYQSPMNWLNHCIGGKPPPTFGSQRIS